MPTQKIVALIVLTMIVVISRQQTVLPNVTIINSDILDNPADNNIMVNGQLTDTYNDRIFNEQLNCKNGYLNIINRNTSKTNGERLLLQLSGLPPVDTLNITINFKPNLSPHPTTKVLNSSLISIEFNC